jgi:hypothetical protein
MQLLAENGNNVDTCLRKLFVTPCSPESAREMSIALSGCFGITQEDFMRAFWRIRRNPL